jgi:hypothetical protein
MSADIKAEADAKAKAQALADKAAAKEQHDREVAARRAIEAWRYEAARADKRERRHQVKLAKLQGATRAQQDAAAERFAEFNAQVEAAKAANDGIELAFAANEIKVLADQVAKLAGDLAVKQVEKDLADMAIQHLIDRTVPAAA